MSSNGTNFDPLAQYARLSERVENQGKDIVDLRSNMNTGFQGVNANLNALSNELRSNSRTPWGIIWTACGVCFTILAALGAFFYGTLSKGQDRLDAAIVKNAEASQSAIAEMAKTMQVSFQAMSERTVSNKELDWRTARSAEDRARTDAAVADLRSNLVPRAEHERVWQNFEDRDKDLQRQIDEVKQAQGSVYGARDVILDLKTNQQRLERELSDMKARGGQP